MSQTSRDRVISRRVRTHEKNSGDAVRRLGTIIQSIFCAQSGANIRLTVWKWSGESWYPGAFPPVLWKRSSRFFSRPDWPSLGLRGTGWLPHVASISCFISTGNWYLFCASLVYYRWNIDKFLLTGEDCLSLFPHNWASLSVFFFIGTVPF